MRRPDTTPSGTRGAALAPPFRLPGEHFTAALGFLALGSLGLVAVAPALSAGAYPDPRVAAVTHLFTLGWITTSILGALYQLLPVALGAPIRSERVAHLGFWLYAPGVLGFVAGLATGTGLLRILGASALGLGLLLFIGNLAATLPRARRRGITWWCVAGAGFFLLGALTLGILLAVNLDTGLLAGGRFFVMGLHLHIAAAGWVLLTMIGVSHRILPMFLLSHGAPKTPGRIGAGLVAAGTGVLLLIHHVLDGGVLPLGYALIAAGLLAFLGQTALWFRRRRRPALDPGLRLVAAALGLLAAAAALGVWALASGSRAPPLLTAYGTVLVAGGLSLFVAGHYYKIVPFLTWFHRFGPVAAEREVPQVAELFAPRPALAAGALMVVGAAGLGAAILGGSAPVARLAAASFAAGVAIEVIQMAGIARRRP